MTRREVRVDLQLDTSGFEVAARRAAAHISSFAHRFTLRFTPAAHRRKHKRRCAICSPFANPRPLTIDGHAYRRRAKGRRR